MCETSYNSFNPYEAAQTISNRVYGQYNTDHLNCSVSSDEIPIASNSAFNSTRLVPASNTFQHASQSSQSSVSDTFHEAHDFFRSSPSSSVTGEEDVSNSDLTTGLGGESFEGGDMVFRGDSVYGDFINPSGVAMSDEVENGVMNVLGDK